MKNVVDPIMKKALLEYLGKASAKDAVLSSKYDPSKIDECCEYIVERIREDYVKANGRKDGGCFCPPENVYKMARDFFIDGKNKIETVQDDDDEGEISSTDTDKESAVPSKKKDSKELEQLELFSMGEL